MARAVFLTSSLVTSISRDTCCSGWHYYRNINTLPYIVELLESVDALELEQHLKLLLIHGPLHLSEPLSLSLHEGDLLFKLLVQSLLELQLETQILVLHTQVSVLCLHWPRGR